MSTERTTDIVMPQMGVSVEEGTVLRWLVAIGDAVTEEQVVCEISTDKVDTEVFAPTSGTITEIVAEEGATVKIGMPLARIGDAGSVPVPHAGAASTEPAPPEPTHASSQPPTAGAGPTPATAPAGPTPVHSAQANGFTPRRHSSSASVAASLSGARIDSAAAATAVLDRQPKSDRPLSSPRARAVAAELGVSMASVTGSGLRGRIRATDVFTAVASGGRVDALPAPADQPATRQTNGARRAPEAVAVRLVGEDDIPLGYEDVPYTLAPTSPHRRAISEHMIRSRQTAAHMTTEADVDMHHLTGIRSEINAGREQAAQVRISFLAFIARAAVAALAEFPDLNATFQHERSIRWNEVNLGIAVDTPSGLIVPVIRGAQRFTVGAIADAIATLAERARSRALGHEDLRAGTFTISNPGSVGAVSAPAIINQPQVAILGTPVIVKRPWVVTMPDGNDGIAARPIMRLALTFDHRAVDGADATRFLVAVKQRLETWGAEAYL